MQIGSAHPLDEPMTMEVKWRDLKEGIPKTMKEATIEDLAFPNHFGGGTASLSPFQRSPHSMRLPASPSRAVPKGPWNPNDWLSANCSSRVPDFVGQRGCLSVASSAAAEKSEEGMA